jgi:hypothetical protein
LSKFFKAIVNASFGMLLNYSNGTVLYRLSVQKEANLVSKGFFFQTESLIKLLKRGYMYMEVPIGLKVRVHGKSNATTWKQLYKVTKDYLTLMANIHIKYRFQIKNYKVLEDTATYRRVQKLKAELKM